MEDDWFDLFGGVSEKLYRYASTEARIATLQEKADRMEKYAVEAMTLLQNNLPAETYNQVMSKRKGLRIWWHQRQTEVEKEKARIQKEREKKEKQKQKEKEIAKAKLEALKKLTPEQIQALGLQSEAKKYKV